MLLKEKIFSGQPDEFSLEEVLESLTKQTQAQEGIEFSVFRPENKATSLDSLEEQALILEESITAKKDIILYETGDDLYYVYTRQEKEDTIWTNYISEKEQENNKDYGLFVPSGVTVRRVPQDTLGTGVLGRAFIHSNYIEILDSLHGNEYQEVLTHEVLHILHPQEAEMGIRQMTRNYLGTNTTYH